jgi:hypothetical protein
MRVVREPSPSSVGGSSAGRRAHFAHNARHSLFRDRRPPSHPVPPRPPRPIDPTDGLGPGDRLLNTAESTDAANEYGEAEQIVKAVGRVLRSGQHPELVAELTSELAAAGYTDLVRDLRAITSNQDQVKV